MGPSRLSSSAALGALALTMGLTGLVPAGATSGAAATAEGSQRAAGSLRMAVDAVGGASALRGLKTFQYRAGAARSILDEGAVPGSGASPAATVEARVRYRLKGSRPPRVRIDNVRTSLGVDRPVREVLSGRRGYISGVDANFSQPATKAMTSDRWAAIHREQELLNPHVLLSRALDRPSLASNGGQRTIDGRRYRVLVLRDAVAPIELFVDVRKERIAMLRTTQHDYLRRDVPIEVTYGGWRREDDGVRFPRRVALTSDGFEMVRERRTEVDVNPRIKGRVFRFPSAVDPVYDADLADIGTRTSEWLLSFVALGFIKDGGQRAINPITITDGTTTAAGVRLLGGVANNSLVVQRPGGVVVFEGALHDHRAEAVIQYIEDSPDFTGPITHVVTTHHHADHASGMRPYVALGATAVVGEQAVPFFQQVFADRGSTVLPDRLDGTTVAANVQGVPAAGLSLPNGIQVFPLQTEHSVDMVVPYVADQGVLFTSDIYSPPGLPSPTDPNAQAIAAMVTARGLTPKWIAGGHGTFISYAAFKAALGIP
ncbi:MBL fold metallo-hydrolase [Nocardioides terrigena]|uniref:MBL fold metallo-hydrolase n=1 Tax=Nocardioides terrigena TaxID=424797 RepID=UPI000D319F3C|nr:MBL fold metallo-hydrolase [Nocardioides terrigena]